MRLQGKYTFADSLRLQLFYRFRRTGVLVLAFVLISIACVAFLAIGFKPRFGLFGFLTLLWSSWLIINAVLMAWTARQHLAQQGCLREPITLVFTAATIEGSRGSGETSKMNWTDLQSIRETKTFFLLYAGQKILPLPKRFFISRDQMRAWMRIASDGIRPKKIASDRLSSLWC